MAPPSATLISSNESTATVMAGVSPWALAAALPCHWGGAAAFSGKTDAIHSTQSTATPASKSRHAATVPFSSCHRPAFRALGLRPPDAAKHVEPQVKQMISSGEVGAVFRIVDEGSPVLKSLMDQFNALEGVIERVKVTMRDIKLPPGLTRSMANLERNMKGVVDQSARMGEMASSGFLKIDESVATTKRMVADLRKEMAAVGTESRRLGGGVGGVPSIRNGGGHSSGGSSNGGVHFGGAAVPLPGDQHMRISGTPLVAAGAAIGYGAYEEAKVQDIANRAFISGGLSTAGLTANPAYEKIRDAILHAYTMTGLPLDQIEEGILTGTRGLAGIDLEKRLALMPGLLSASATEAYLKDGTTIPEAMQAFVGLAHMEGKYSPAEIAKLADHFAYLSTTTPVSVKQIEGAASYAIPMLRTANFDPEQTLLMITAMERAGITNTKAGTWISQLATQSFPGTSLMSKMLFAKHESALRDLGLIDAHHRPTWFADGRPDLVKMTGIAADRIEKMDEAHRLAIEKALWGQQGGRAAGFFADPTNRAIMARVAADEKNFISGEAMWKQSLENSPIVQFRTAFAGLNVELMNLGSNVLPFATSALKQANDMLGGKGELALLAGAVGAWFNRGLIGSGAKALGSKLLGLGAGAASLPALIDSITDDNRTPEAKANDERIMSMIRSWVTPNGGPPPPNRLTRSALPYLNSQDLQGIGNEARAAAPAQNTTVNVTTNLQVDGRTLASVVEKYLVQNNRTVTGASGADGQAMALYPDHGMH